MSEVYIDCDLITLAYLYLKKKHKPFDIVDVILACHEILNRIELRNRDGKKISFKDNHISIDEAWLKESVFR